MALTFPSSPTNGQVYSDTTTGNRYIYDSTNNIWKFAANNVGMSVSSTPPANVAPGAMWFNSSIGRTFLYYDDGDSKQWVETVPAGTVDTNTIAGYVNPVFASMNGAYTTANAAYTGITAPVIVYSKDGPQASYSPYYISNGVNNTASISFNNTITGAAGTLSKLKIIVGGAINSSSAGSDSVNIYTGSVTSTATKFNASLVLTSSTAIYMSASVNTASLLGAADVLRIVFSSSATHASSTTTSIGWWVYVTGSNT